MSREDGAIDSAILRGNRCFRPKRGSIVRSRFPNDGRNRLSFLNLQVRGWTEHGGRGVRLREQDGALLDVHPVLKGGGMTPGSTRISEGTAGRGGLFVQRLRGPEKQRDSVLRSL